jgi:hypothetical protein
MGLEWLGQFKNPITSSGIKPLTFRLVACCFKQLRYRIPHLRTVGMANCCWPSSAQSFLVLVLTQLMITFVRLMTLGVAQLRLFKDGVSSSDYIASKYWVMYLIRNIYGVHVNNTCVTDHIVLDFHWLRGRGSTCWRCTRSPSLHCSY